MKKLQSINIAILGVLSLLSLIFLIKVGFSEIIYDFSRGIDDVWGIGIPQLGLLILSTVYLIYAILFYIKNKAENKLIKSGIIINFIAIGLSLVLFIFGLIGYSKCAAHNPMDPCALAIIFVALGASIIIVLAMIPSIILFLIGYYKK
jgi:hypothetical protein